MRLLSYAVLLAPFETLALALVEGKRPLRDRRYDRTRRTVVNVALAATAGATLATLYPFIVLPVARRRHRATFGRNESPPAKWARTAATVLALDATLWLWHRLNHRVPFLWQFHAVHHLDGDLDVSTALRFHAGELALSTLWRAAQVALIGADVRTLLAWELAVLWSIQFHHANLRLPPRLDAALRPFIATPRLHGIHHSRRRDELDSNFANLFTMWDRLFGTYRAPQRDAVTIGLSAFRAEERLSLGYALTLPWERDDRILPQNQPGSPTFA